MQRLLAALLIALALPASAQELAVGRIDGFTMLDRRIGVIVTGLDGIPDATARAIVGGFLEALGSGGGDMLGASRVMVVRGYPASVGGVAPGLVIDWRVSIDGGGDLGALYSLIEGAADWADIDPARAAAIGLDAGERLRDTDFTAALIRAEAETPQE